MNNDDWNETSIVIRFGVTPGSAVTVAVPYDEQGFLLFKFWVYVKLNVSRGYWSYPDVAVIDG